ncbi:MAG: cation:proton antiporter, partial [Solobacterium sp.]|nr:cation:proton antiporter [Solobacterium sp.]
MLFSFAMIILVGVVFAMIMRKLGLPNLLGYLLAGIILGPFVFNVIDTPTFKISSDIRQIALMIILMRA